MLNYIDLFAGAGGFSLGFKLAEYEHVCSVEKDEWAVETLKANFDNEKIIKADLTNYNGFNDYYSGSIDVIIGGPPCQGFSNASSAKKDIDDPRNSLFINFIQWVNNIQPTFFVMENVKGILTKRNKKKEKISDIITSTFKEAGYTVDIWVLNAAEYGVPQLRERVFFVGNKLGISIEKPNTTHYINKKQKNRPELLKAITVGQAILDLPVIKAKEGKEIARYTKKASNDYQKWARNNSEFVFNHVAMKHTSRLIERFRLIQEGNKLEEIHEDYKVRMRNGNGELSSSKFNSNYRHLKKESISNTIPASFYSSFIHPIIPRNITAREAARIQSFPDNYIFKGDRTLISKNLLRQLGKPHDRLSQYNQVGNAVPPLLSKAIAQHLNRVFNNYKLLKQSNKILTIAE